MKKLLAVLALCASTHAEKYTVFVGTYTAPNASKGIYKFAFDSENGSASAPELAAEIASPSFLAIHQNGRFLYAVNEAGSGAVTAFSIDPQTRKLTKLNDQPSGGGGPCHINVDREGKNVLIANYGGGSVAVFPIAGDGGLKAASSFVQHTGSSVNPNRQKEPHGHSINLDMSGKFAFAADLGTDKIYVYKFDSAGGKLTEHGFAALKAGSGPRHSALTKDGKRLYVINELFQTVTGFNHDGHGKLSEFQTISTVPQETPGNSTAEIVIHPSGKFVYGSNRGHNSIAVFSVGDVGKLTRIQNEPTQGQIPRNFNIDSTGRFLLAANQDSGNVAIFSINQLNGKLTFTGKSVAVAKPVCIRFLKE